MDSTLPSVGPYGCHIGQPADVTTPEGRLTERIRLAAQLYLLPATQAADLSYLRAMPVLTARGPLPVKHAPRPDVSQLAMATVPDFRVDLAKLPRPTSRAAAKEPQAA